MTPDRRAYLEFVVAEAECRLRAPDRLTPAERNRLQDLAAEARRELDLYLSWSAAG